MTQQAKPMSGSYKLGMKIVVVVFAIISTKVFAQPNLTPYQPSGWSDKIVVATTTGTTTDSTSLTTADTLYVNWAVINDGTASANGTFYTYLYVDGVFQSSWTINSLGVDFYTYVTDYSIGSLSAGTHTIEIYADATGVIAESNESDNSYTKTITVNNPDLPNLAPYQPPGWSDKIVVSRTANSITDSTSLTTADSLYLDWAVINNGNAAVTGTFYTYLYVDGTYRTDWSAASLNAGSYTYVTNYFLGSLNAGTHTIEIYANATGTIAESNVGDNFYTKTITVNAVNLPAPALNSPANGSAGQSTTPTFNWSSIMGASSYRIMIAANAADLPSDPTATTGGPSVVVNTTTASTSFTPSTPLNADTTYYWEVHAQNTTQPGNWSSVNNFTTSPPAGGLTIIPTFDSSITSDPQAATIEATINSAIAVYKSNFSDPITVSIKFQEMNSGLGQSSWTYQTISYSNYRAALVAHATTTDDATALAHLPNSANNPVNSNQEIDIKPPLARALGFNVNPPAGQPDGTISLYTAIMNLSSAQTDPDKYSLFAAASHEIDEVLGLGSALDLVKNGNGSLTGAIFSEDLFRYNQAGARSYTTNVNATSYFSLDGTTDLAQFNQVVSGDFGDWYSYPSGAEIPRVQDAFATPGATPVLGVELRVLDAIGYSLITPASTPIFQTVTNTANTIAFTWTAISGRSYQVQDTTNLVQAVWNNVGNTVTANGSTASFSDPIGPDRQRFYRVELLSAPASNLIKAEQQIFSGPLNNGTNYLHPLHP